MSMFRNVKERGIGLFSGNGAESRKGHGKTPANRRTRAIRLESLENRQLLSVSPGVTPSEACDLAQYGGDAEKYTEPVALVSTMDPTAGIETAIVDALPEASEDTGTAPVIADDAFAMTSTQQLGSGVLANDVDADGDKLTVSLDSDVTHGQLNLESDGLFTYRPDPQFSGIDSFTYTVSDGVHEVGPATVTIEVTGAEGHSPEAVADTYSLSEDESLIVSRSDGLLANDSDADGDPLYANLVEAPEHGTLTIGRYGSFTYTPDSDFNGIDQFTYMASDIDGEGGLATVTLTVEAVNDAPVSADDAYAVSEDEVLTIDVTDGLAANDSDADGDKLSISVVDEPSHGTVTVAEDGSFVYTPESNFYGEDSFTYVASDGQIDTEVASVTIMVEAVNDAPTAGEDAYSVAEDNALIVEAGEGVLANDADAEGDALTVSLVGNPSHGIVTLAEDGSFEYTPEAGFHGEDSFTYVTSDGQAESTETLVAIAVESINDAPVSADDAYSVAEDGVLTVDTIGGVLANDSDADGDTLTVSIVDEPSHGSVTLAEDGSFEYTPAADFAGEDSFTYLAGDGQAESEVTTVAITVEAANDAPAPAADAYAVSEDDVLTVEAIGGVLSNDLDVDGDALSVSLVDEPTHGVVTLAEDGSFVYTPEADFHGEDSFTYVASDGQAESGPIAVAITVEAVNDVPISSADAYMADTDGVLAVEAEAGVLANDADVDGDALSARLVESPTNGTVVLGEDGSFEYTPDPGFQGEDTFTYVSADGQAESEVTTVAITVGAVNVEVTDAQLSIQLQVSATPFGAEVDTLWTDSTFWVSAFVEDLRDVPAGVIGGAIDLTYDAAEVTPTGEVAYGEAFDLFQQGEVNGEEGLVDEAGALTATAMVGADEAAPFVSWQFTRTGDAIHTQFAVDPAEGTSTILPSNFALSDSGVPVEWSNVEMGSAEVGLVFADFNGDQHVDHFDLALWVPHSDTAAGDAGYQPMFDLNASDTIDQADLDLLMSGMYTAMPTVEAPAPAEEPGSAFDDALISAVVDLDLGSDCEGEGDESAPVQALDDLFASGEWA